MSGTATGPRPIRVLQLRSLRGIGGGPERTIAAYACGGGPPGFEVSVCYLRNREDPDFVVGARMSGLGIDYHQVLEDGAVDAKAWRQLRTLVAELRPDVLHCHDYKANLLGWWMSRSLPFALMSSSHGWAATNARERFVYYPGDRLLLSRFACVVAVSDDIRATLLRWGAHAQNVVVARNAVDTETLVRRPAHSAQVRAAIRLELGLDPDAFVLGFVGRLDAEKRVGVLLEAVALLRRSEPRVALLIVGDGSMRSVWTAQAARLGILDACRFVGAREDVPALHHAMDVYVQSSRTEGTSNALLEAMALRTPIVATAVGGTAELVEDGVHGLMVAPEDPRALAEGIGRILRDPQAAEARAGAARARAESELSLTRWQDRMSGIYREVDARNRARRFGAAARTAPVPVPHAEPGLAPMPAIMHERPPGIGSDGAGVSYIIPARNEAASISRAVHSILAHPAASAIEVLVVVNGSTDATAEVASAVGARVLLSSATTAAGARNDGARAATGELLCFIDADCAVAPDHLASVRTAFAGGAAAVGARCISPAGGTAIQRAWALQRTDTQACDVAWLSSGNFAIRRAAFEDVDGFEETLTTCEDYDIGYRLTARGYRLRCDPAIVAHHLREPASLSEFVAKEAWRGRDSLRSFLRHGRPAREIPSLLFPLIAIGLPVIGCAVAIAGALRIGATIAVVGLLAPLAMALRTAFVTRQPRAVGMLILLYCGWALGRFIALAREVLTLPRMLRARRLRNRTA